MHRMGHLQDQFLRHPADRLLTQLAVHDAILKHPCERISKNQARRFEAHAVLAEIGAILGVIPFEFHGNYVTTNKYVLKVGKFNARFSSRTLALAQDRAFAQLR